MKFVNSLKKAAALTSALVLTGVYLLTPNVSAIPYDPNGPGLDKPGFNVYTGTPSVGDESDFLRGKEDGTTGYINDVNSNCNNGQTYTLRVYVHNGANAIYNASGQGIARDTKVRVNMPGATPASGFQFTSAISASNASTVTDGMNLNCANGKKVKLSYIAGTASQYTVPGGNQKLSDAIVTTGAPIGTKSPDGNVEGCWDQRVWVTLQVKVEEQPQEVNSLGVCKLLTVETSAGRKVTANITEEVQNATITGYKINWGDGSTSDKKSDSHQYASDGKYTITAEVRVKYADGREEWKSADTCKMDVTFKGDTPPTVTPPTSTTPKPTALPSTGPAGVAAAVTLVSAASTAAYYFVQRRRLGQF